MALLDVEIEKHFPAAPDSPAFRLSVAFEAGAGMTVLFGPSGSGKTLTLESIAGFVRPDRGHVTLEGEALFDARSRIHLPPRKRKCGYLFQADALFPHMTVRGNLEFAAAALPAGERQRRIGEILEHFRIAALAGRRPHEISGGERQRCSIARTLLGNPRVLLLDEPARGLDIDLRRQLYRILRQVRVEFELPMLLVTHDLEEAFELSDHMLLYSGGRIEQKGAPGEVLERPANGRVARLLGLTNVFEGRVASADGPNGNARLETEEFSVNTPPLPGRAVGDVVGFCIRADRVLAAPANGGPRAGRRVLRLLQAVEMPDQVRLEFEGAISAHVPRPFYESRRGAEQWEVEFPADAVWVFPAE
jgi:molybdate transport system ATP-binding protein